MKYYIGIDLGGTNIAAGVVNEDYEIVAQYSVKTKSGRPAEEILDDMALAARNAAQKAGLSMDEIEWVGIGAPGTANKAKGVIEYSNNLNWLHLPIVAMMEERLQKKIYIEHDANAAAYGEYIAGSAKDADISVMVTLGTGVGGGVVINNKIYTGTNYAGIELGHEVIVVDGRECTCGRRGCLEAYASATGLALTTREYMQKNPDSYMWKLCEGDLSCVNGKTAFDAMRAGDAAGAAVVEEYVKYLACGVTNIINTFQPDILSIGGGISHEKEFLLEPLKAIVSKEVYSRDSDKNAEIVAASLGNAAGIIGAALLGLEK